MKKAIIILSIITYSNLCYTQIWQVCFKTLKYFDDYYSCETYDDWLLVFEDEFNETDIDYSVWDNRYPWGRYLYCPPKSAEYNTDGDNHEVSNGKLKLIAKEQDTTALIMPEWEWDEVLICKGEPWDINQQSFNYTSGMIFSKQKFIHGKFEINCKIPEIDRLWPAFWIYGGCGQEIDIFEFLGKNPNPEEASEEPSYAYHREIDCSDDEDAVQCSFDDDKNTDMSNDFHIYSVEWDEHKMIWRIDNEIVQTRYKYYDYVYGTEKTLCGNINGEHWWEDLIYPKDDIPMSIIASIGVKDESNASFPVYMEIDYIRVYQKINSSGSVQICSNSDIQGSTVAGQEITVGGPLCTIITLNDGEFLTLAAKEKIVLHSSIEIEEGAVFSMIISE